MRLPLSVLAIPIIVGLARADEADPSWQIQGQVVDDQGTPVEEFEAATFWSSNGIYWDDAGKTIQVNGLADAEKIWKDEGVLVSPPRYLATRRSKGEFSLTVEGLSLVSVFAVDKRHERGGVVFVPQSAAETPVRITIAPLVRVTGEVYCSEAGRTPDWTNAVVYPIGDDGAGAKFTQCGSLRGKFSFLLPPGPYLFQVRSSSPNARIPESSAQTVKDAAGRWSVHGIRLDIPEGKSTLDLGVIDLFLPRDDNGIARDYSQFYGKEPPALSITDARGVPKTVKLADFRGKWVLLDFWATWCGPCVHGSLPELTKFYEEHAADRDRFEILAICNTKKEKARTIEAYDALTASIVENVWAGKQLPFPVLVDGDGETAGVYGIVGWPTELLIDPEGHLVKNGDLALLAENLSEKKP